jgi:MraZ protein
MDRFVSTFINKLDAKGRVSVPASFRDVLARDAYSGGEGAGIYCYPSLDAPALDAGGESLARTIDALLEGLDAYSDERDQLSVALYGDVHVLKVDGDGRIVLPEELRRHAGLEVGAEVTFVGLGGKFQIWNPKRFDEFRAQAREKVRDHRKLLHAGRRSGDATPRNGDEGARE